MDTSALIMGLDPLGLDFESYSVPEVADELREQTGPSYRLTVSRSSGKLTIRSPTTASLEEVAEKARVLGDRVVLSKADTSVLALALDLRGEGKTPVIVSDDYAVQNVAEGIRIAYQPLATLGIREKFSWIYYCPACYRQYAQTDLQVCQVCGTKLKRKPVQKEAAKGRHSER
ncbi:MAG: NOB1 family endonuclease [Candidatus Bathyarchaeia archaeon]